MRYGTVRNSDTLINSVNWKVQRCTLNPAVSQMHSRFYHYSRRFLVINEHRVSFVSWELNINRVLISNEVTKRKRQVDQLQFPFQYIAPFLQCTSTRSLQNFNMYNIYFVRDFWESVGILLSTTVRDDHESSTLVSFTEKLTCHAARGSCLWPVSSLNTSSSFNVSRERNVYE